MKKMSFAILATSVILVSAAFAQTAQVKDIPMDSSQDTTISISKGKGSNEKEFDLINGTADVAGDQSPLTNGAKANWKKACLEWKTELKELNKDNQILAMNCGNPNCKKEEHGSTCTSAATYQLKVRMRK